MLRRVWCRKGPKCCSASWRSTCDGWPSRTRRGVGNGHIVSFIRIESAAGASDVGARSRRGRSAGALADDLSVRPFPARATTRLAPSHRVPPDLRQSRCRSLHIRCACDDGRGQNHAGPEPRWPRPVDARDPLLTPRPTARPPQGQWRKPTGPGGGGRCACTSGISRRSSPELASGRLPEHFDR